MERRKMGKTTITSTILGIGSVPFQTMALEETKKIIDSARENDISFIDVFVAEKEVRSNIGNAIKDHREDFIIQGHLCTKEVDGQTVRTRDLLETKASFEALFHDLHTDYIDIGMFFYIDDQEDFEAVFHTPIYEYAKELKTQGRIGAIGMGSHNPRIALRAVEKGFIDVLMFSLNPAYDLAKTDADIFSLKDHHGFAENGPAIDKERQKLYLTCEEKGVAITVMKALGAGSLLSDDLSPFGKGLTVPQCIHYALERPAVTTVVLGCRSVSDIDAAVAYCHTKKEDLSYSHIYEGLQSVNTEGRCMYCNHCQPCPAHIDIAAVTKFLDLAQGKSQVSATVLDHYFALKYNANDCLMCGDCEESCPFGVDVRRNMEKAQAIFTR